MIFLGSFSTDIAIFLFDPINKTLELNEIMENCCYNLKPGISSIAVLDETLMIGQKKSYLITGSFDYRIRFYDLDKHKPLGYFKYISSRINQIKLAKNEENIFLMVASDENSFYIWLLC